MNRRTRRWISMLLLGALAFLQATSVVAACAMERSQLAVMFSAQGHECCDQDNSGADTMPMSANECLSHATADLQAFGTPVLVVCAPCRSAAMLLVSQDRGARFAIGSLAAPPPKVVPPRILLHSFLI
jgi:hypothetical protein